MQKLFIIDYNEELVEILLHVLSKDYVIKARLDTANVVSDIVSFSPDLLIIDHSVGDVKSADILKELRTVSPLFAAPVVLFSAHSSVKDIAAETGANGYIEKPADISYIRNYIKDMIARSHHAN